MRHYIILLAAAGAAGLTGYSVGYWHGAASQSAELTRAHELLDRLTMDLVDPEHLPMVDREPLPAPYKVQGPPLVDPICGGRPCGIPELPYREPPTLPLPQLDPAK